MKNLKFTLKLLSIAIATLFAQQTFSQVSSVDAQLQIVSTGENSYLEKSVGFGTKTQTPDIETPISEQVVTQELIKDKQILTPNDLTNVVSAVQPMPGYGNSPSQWFIIRGFDNQSVNYRDGFRISEPYTSSPRDMANVEQVEFVKGPTSSLYGAAQPGGAVNTVTKSANFNENFANVTGTWGSNQYLRETIDINQVFGDVAARLNVAHDAGNSYIDLQQSKNYVVAPTFRWKISSETELEYKGEFQRTSYTGFANGLPNLPFVTSLPANYTYAQPWNYLINSNQTQLINFTTSLDDDWKFRQGLFYATSSRSDNLINPAQVGDPVGSYAAPLNGTSVMIQSWAGPMDNPTNYSSQTEIYGKIQQGAITHNVLAGYELTNTRFNFMFASGPSPIGYPPNGSPDCSLACANVNNGPPQIPNLSTFNQYNYQPSLGQYSGFSGTNSTANTNAFYLQDQLSYGNWRLLGTIRNQLIQSSVDTYADPSGAISKSQYQTNRATTGRIGLLYMLTKNASIYYNWGQGFVPNLGADYYGTLFAPERSWQQEAGVKVYVLPGLEASAAAFSIVKNNYLTSDPNHPLYSLAIGQVTSKGFEASLTGQVNSRLRVIANAASVHAVVASDQGNPSSVGSTLTGVPGFSSNLWAVQDIALDLPGKTSIGAGVVQVGPRPAALPNLSYFNMPGYVSADLGAFYKLKNLDFALNVKNVNNAVILTTQQGNNVFRQQGRSFLFTVGAKF